jgi:hypothetical protein
MRPPEVENPGGQTGAVMVNQNNDYSYNNQFPENFQAIFRLFYLQLLIPADGYFEPELSLAIDRAVLQVEAAL